jgi:hypothetical protein
MARAGLLLSLFAMTASGEEMPVEQGVTLLLKVLTYEAGFEAKGSGEFVVLVPYGAEGRGRADAAVEALAPVAKAKVKTRALSFVPVKSTEISATHSGRKVSAVLLLPGSDASVVNETGRLGRDSHIYTLGLDEDSVRSGAALGVTAKEGKPQVLLNVAQAKAEGSEFPQSILKVAKLIR